MARSPFGLDRSEDYEVERKIRQNSPDLDPDRHTKSTEQHVDLIVVGWSKFLD